MEARFGGGADYYGGVVVRAHGDGSVDVQYDDEQRAWRWPIRHKRHPALWRNKLVDSRLGR